MEPFMDVFFTIDTEQKEEITLEQLSRYAKVNHLDQGLVTRWRSLFDKENSGKVTLARFCEVLGLKPEEARHRRQTTKNFFDLNPDIKVIFSNMPWNYQIEIATEAIRLAKSTESSNMDQLTKSLKKWLDEIFGFSWEVLVVRGSHWMTYSHLPASSFHFRYGQHSYLIWRVPNAELVD